MVKAVKQSHRATAKQSTTSVSIRMPESFRNALERAASSANLALSPYLVRLLKSSPELQQFLIADLSGGPARRPREEDPELAFLCQLHTVGNSFDRLTHALRICMTDRAPVDALRIVTELHAIALLIEQLQRCAPPRHNIKQECHQ